MNQNSQSHVSTITETVTLLSDLILKQQQLLTQRPLLPWECEDEAEPTHLSHVPQCLAFLSLLTYLVLFIFVNVGITELDCGSILASVAGMRLAVCHKSEICLKTFRPPGPMREKGGYLDM